MLDWVIAHPKAATALAAMSLVAVGLFIGAGQIAVIWIGIRAMDRSSAARKADRDAAQEEARKRFEADERRHEEAMRALERQVADTAHRHEESMAALKALIERTAPQPAPAG